MFKRFCLVFCFVCIANLLIAETLLEKPNLQIPSKIAPFYFGPNAFPVPDMLDSSTSDELKVELSGDYYVGFAKDWTADVFAKISIKRRFK